MTVLSVIQTFCKRSGLPVPNALFGSQDTQIIQLTGLAQEVVEDICDRWTWTELTREATFTTLAVEDQGKLSTIASQGFLRILQDTIYDRTLRRPLYGPVSASEWQARKALPVTGPLYRYRIREGHLLLIPTPAAGHQLAFEYASSYSILASDGATYKSEFTADTDTFILDEKFLQAGLRWKWRSEKGLDYAEELERYESLLNNATGRDGTKPTLNLGDTSLDAYQPGIFVPAGNWPLGS